MSARIVSIPPGRPFLKVLAEALVDGRLVPSFTAKDDPLALADATVYVPTRRAALSLAGEFSELIGPRGAILPAIRAIGENDETMLFADPQVLPSLDPVMGDLERRLSLARLTRQWRQAMAEAEYERLIGEEAALPASSADALWVAGDLAALLDEFETEERPLASILTLAGDDFADWWQLTLAFLSILTEHWPRVLKESGKDSAMAARNAWLRTEARRLRAATTGGPVVLAGSTATAPATVDLMRAIAGLERGALVLPGLDRDLDAAARAQILSASASAPVSAPGHHQFGLLKILSQFAPGEAAAEAVVHLDAGEPEEGGARVGSRAREAFLSDALRPAETTEAWADAPSRHGPDALDGVALIEAGDEREEALGIACAMRFALSDPNATCAVVTPDRNLARRIVSELARFNIAANDSAGRPLMATAPGTLMTLVIKVALEPGDPIALVSLLKHPLTRLGLGGGQARRAARAIEMIALRGSVGIADGAGIAGLFARRRAAMEEEDHRHVALPIRHLPAAERDLGQAMAEALETALAPLSDLRHVGRGADGASDPDDGIGEIGVYANALTRVLEAIAADEDGDASNLYATEAGRSLESFLRDLVEAPATGFAFAPRELADVVDALGAGVSVRPRGGLSARAFVWGTLEARLQHVDTAILAGLNEGTWPAGPQSGAFLSRVMRGEIDLDMPERRIGLAAHDFWMAAGARRLILSRSRRSQGAPTLASRWVQRLTTLAGPQGSERLRAAGEPYLEAARFLDHRALAPLVSERATRPAPRPPLEARPTTFSITEVETLIRDPYAIHARRILRLEPLPDLMRDPHAAERGSLFHDVLGTFCQRGHDPMADDAHDTLLAIARARFADEKLPPEIEAVWWPRMEALAVNFLDWERARDGRVAERRAEISGRHDFAELGTVLNGRADRIDRMTSGGYEILDFKTGTQPSIAQARSLLAPQLPLEGGLAKLGAFAQGGASGAGGISIEDLVYVRLRERTLSEDRFTGAARRGGEAPDPDASSEEALQKFRGLVATYRREETPFVSRARPFRASDFSGAYDHLARAEEWSIGTRDGGGEE